MAEDAKDGVKGGWNEGAPVPVEDQENEIDVVVLVQTLLRGKGTIARVTAVAFLMATMIAFVLPLRYTSATSFVPPGLNGGGSMASALAGQLSMVGGAELLGGIKSPGDLYVGILKSRSIADELIKRLDLMRVYRVTKESQAEAILDSGLDIVVDPKSSIVMVHVTAKSPELAQQLAGAYMDALRETNGRLALGQSSQRRLFFGQQLAKEKDDLEDAEVDLKKTEEQSGLIAPTGQTEMEIDTIAQTQAQIAVRQVQLAALREGGTEENPEVVRLRSEISDLQGQLARLQNGSGRSSTTIPTSKVPEVQLEYVRKEREVKYHEALFDMLSRQYEAARLDEARDAPVLQVLDPPSYPDSKSGPKRLYIMLGGLVVGFFASCAWVLGRNHVHAFLSSLASSEVG
jgi:tyrosine-protein kinase Etk/Wzc